MPSCLACRLRTLSGPLHRTSLVQCFLWLSQKGTNLISVSRVWGATVKIHSSNCLWVKLPTVWYVPLKMQKNHFKVRNLLHTGELQKEYHYHQMIWCLAIVKRIFNSDLLIKWQAMPHTGEGMNCPFESQAGPSPSLTCGVLRTQHPRETGLLGANNVNHTWLKDLCLQCQPLHHRPLRAVKIQHGLLLTWTENSPYSKISCTKKYRLTISDLSHNWMALWDAYHF